MKFFWITLSIFSTILPNFGNSQDYAQHQITLYYLPYCPYSKRVLHYLEDNKKTIPLKNVQGNQAAKNELKAKGGLLLVPCLIVDDKAIYSDDAIIDWLSSHLEWLESVYEPRRSLSS